MYGARYGPHGGPYSSGGRRPGPGYGALRHPIFRSPSMNAMRNRHTAMAGSFRNRVRADMGSTRFQLGELARLADGSREGSDFDRSGRNEGFSDGSRRLSPRGGGRGLVGGRPSRMDTHGDDFVDEDEIAEEGDFGGGPAFGGSTAFGGPVMHPRGPLDGEDEIFQEGGFGGGPPFDNGGPHNLYSEYNDYGAFSDDEYMTPGYGGHGLGDSLGFDPEYLSSAVDDEDIDDVVTQSMNSGAGPSEGAPPASNAAIASLKKKKVDRGMMDAKGKADCSVCMETVGVGEEVTELPCKHWFHDECITHWLSAHGTCPHCRESITSNNDPSPSGSSRPSGGPRAGGGLRYHDEERTMPIRGYGGASHYRSPSLRNDEALARRLQQGNRLRPSVHDDEALARRLQEETGPSVHDDEALARRLQEESRPSLHDDETLARRLQEDSRPSICDDEALARQLYEESRPPVHDDEAFARRLYEESRLPVHDDEAFARTLQEEADHEAGR